jgi:1-phosphatidylinositol phosphodiesterase
MALGNGTDTPGVNQKLLPFLQALKGKRVGIISAYGLLSFDWCDGVLNRFVGCSARLL